MQAARAAAAVPDPGPGRDVTTDRGQTTRDRGLAARGVYCDRRCELTEAPDSLSMFRHTK